MGLIAAIDPGNNAGVVVVRRDRIVAAATVRSRPAKAETYGAFAERMRGHALAILAELVGAADRAGRAEDLEAIAVEGFDDQRGRRHYSDRWKTPFLCGVLESVFADSVLPTPTWQTADVLGRRGGYGEIYDLWQRGRTGLIPGDELLEGDEHRCSAACHALHAERVLFSNRRRGR